MNYRINPYDDTDTAPWPHEHVMRVPALQPSREARVLQAFKADLDDRIARSLRIFDLAGALKAEGDGSFVPAATAARDVLATVRAALDRIEHDIP